MARQITSLGRARKPKPGVPTRPRIKEAMRRKLQKAAEHGFAGNRISIERMVREYPDILEELKRENPDFARVIKEYGKAR